MTVYHQPEPPENPQPDDIWHDTSHMAEMTLWRADRVEVAMSPIVVEQIIQALATYEECTLRWVAGDRVVVVKP